MDDLGLAIILLIVPFIALLVLDEWRHRTRQLGRHRLHKESSAATRPALMRRYGLSRAALRGSLSKRSLDA